MVPIRPEDVDRMPWHARKRALVTLQHECVAAADRHRRILAARGITVHAAMLLASLEPEDSAVVAERRRALEKECNLDGRRPDRCQPPSGTSLS